MPHPPAIHVPGALCYVRVEWSGQARLLATPSARQAYLACLAQALGPQERLLGWALLPDAAHLAVLVGARPLGRLLRSLHGAWARWVRRRQETSAAGRAGPGRVGRRGRAGRRHQRIGLRPRVVYCHAGEALELLRYLHGLPVMAGLAATPAEGELTSYQAYLRAQPPWLARDLAIHALRQTGAVDHGAAGTAHAAAAAGVPGARARGDRAASGTDAEASPGGHVLSPDQRRQYSSIMNDSAALRSFRGRLEQALAQPGRAALGPPDFVAALGRSSSRLAGPLPGRRPLAAGLAPAATPPDPLLLCAAVAAETSTPLPLVRGRARVPAAARARRIVAWLWVEHYRQPQRALAAVLGLGPNAIAQMLRRLRLARRQVSAGLVARVAARVAARLAQERAGADQQAQLEKRSFEIGAG